MNNTKRTVISVVAIIAVLVTLLISSKANATFIEGINFPQGEASFAEKVVSYTPGGTTIDDATEALGIPDSPTASLGPGGTIILEFNENFLVTSGDSAKDLWIFERGTLEPTDVFISSDGVTWISVGEVPGGVSGVDIDSFIGSGVLSGREYKFVKLIDKSTGLTSNGADIDAVGASSSRPPEVASYARTVVDYIPGAGVLDDATEALGIPDTPSATLGLGGTIILTFDQDLLTTSGDSKNDLWIFEEGNPEATDVYISIDGVTWISLGEVPGGVSGVDLDSFVGSGVTAGLEYDYVKLVDKSTIPTGNGADIDAVVVSSLLDPTACIDIDGDGYGSPGNSTCPNGQETDCDDNNSAVNPGALEIFSEGSTCSDTVDNNCDGIIDTDDNNCKSELEVTSLSNPPKSRLRGTKFKITDVVTNTGADTDYEADSAGVSTVRYYLSKDEFIDSGDILLKGTRAVPVLLNGETSGGSIPTKVKIPFKTRRGSYFVIACSDDTKEINEGNEFNNCTFSTTKIKVIY